MDINIKVHESLSQISTDWILEDTRWRKTKLQKQNDPVAQQYGTAQLRSTDLDLLPSQMSATYLRNVDKALPEEKLKNGVRDMHRPER